MCGGAGGAELVQKSVEDTFSAKATATLTKRTAALWSFFRHLHGFGCMPLRFTEEQVYSYINHLRDQKRGATAPASFLQALQFFNGMLKFKEVAMGSVFSARVKGAARSHYETKRPLKQARPLTVAMLKTLERIAVKGSGVARLVAGHVCWCVFSCSRWSDSTKIQMPTFSEARGVRLVESSSPGLSPSCNE